MVLTAVLCDQVMFALADTIYRTKLPHCLARRRRER